MIHISVLLNDALACKYALFDTLHIVTEQRCVQQPYTNPSYKIKILEFHYSTVRVGISIFQDVFSGLPTAAAPIRHHFNIY